MTKWMEPKASGLDPANSRDKDCRTSDTAGRRFGFKPNRNGREARAKIGAKHREDWTSPTLNRNTQQIRQPNQMGRELLLALVISLPMITCWLPSKSEHVALLQNLHRKK